ncbi:MAG: type II secretion system protein N [Betaproteobacteria bacterium]|nr:type II secretion system protein N [Betaproteobacteria bacterium]
MAAGPTALGRWLALSLIAALAGIAVAIGNGPATWVDAALRLLSHDRVRLAEASGVWWRGEGRLVLLDGSPQTPVSAGFALPGPLRWELRLAGLPLGVIDATLSLPGAERPLRLSGTLAQWRLEPGAVRLPAVDLSRLGSPWNTIQPSAELSLRWEPLLVRADAVEGRFAIEFSQVSSAMTPVRPLGHYRVEVVGAGPQATLSLATLSGPLQLTGSGHWSARGGLRLTAQAWGEGAEQPRLQSLLALIGRREGERTIIRIGG